MKLHRFFAIVTIAIGLAAVIASVWKGTDVFKLIKPFFHLGLIIYYIIRVKEVNLLIFAFLGSTMIAEYLAASDFILYFELITILFTVYFTIGFLLMYPVLRVTKRKLAKWTDILALLAVVFVLLYIISTVFILSIEQIKEFTLFTIATFAFTVFVGSCLMITGFHKHPKKVFLFITGVGYVLVCTCALIYELFHKNDALLVLVNTTEVISQCSFVYFLIYKDQFLKKDTWYI